ncbi:MAG: hypothetical protein LBK73_12545 [Treponema sp.]|nr:hypothetical protein [Treponema sp.]
MKLIVMGELGNETIYNPNHIVRVTKSMEGGKPCIKILTVTDNLDTICYENEAEYLKNITALRKALEEA